MRHRTPGIESPRFRGGLRLQSSAASTEAMVRLGWGSVKGDARVHARGCIDVAQELWPKVGDGLIRRRFAFA